MHTGVCMYVGGGMFGDLEVCDGVTTTIQKLVGVPFQGGRSGL